MTFTLWDHPDQRRRTEDCSLREHPLSCGSRLCRREEHGKYPHHLYEPAQGEADGGSSCG